MAQTVKMTEAENVPRRQYSLFQPKYEELYTFWWKCMQITLHDKGTQTMDSEEEASKEVCKDLQPEELTKLINGGDPASLQHILSSIDDDITPPQLDLSTDLTDTNKTGENDQMKQLMAMLSYYNSVGRDNRTKCRTFRGAGALAQGISPSMLAPLSGISLSDIQNTMGQSGLSASMMVDTTLDSTPVMEQRAQLTPISTSTPAPSSSPLKDTNPTPAIETTDVPQPSSPSLLNHASTTVTSSTTTPVLSTPEIMTTPVKSEMLEHQVEIKTEGNSSPKSDGDSDLEQLKASLKMPSPGSDLEQLKASLKMPGAELYEAPENLNDLLQIKQLTDALGRKAVLDSLTVSNAQDLSSYLNMAQAASLIGQLPNSNARSLFNPLGNMSLYMGQAMKTDGAYSSLSNVKLEQHARHYAANSENDTSVITLPEGFEVDDTLTWSDVENFVNEFKTKRVKLGYTQAHVGAALALVHGPEFSQTTISRFEGLQLSFANHKKIIPILRRWLESVENPAKRKHSPNGMHNHQNNHNSKRRKRTTISSNSKEILEQYYQTNPLPSTEEIGNLSNNLALDKRVIRIWFQNRRAIGKRLSKLIVTMGGGAHHSNSQSQIQTMKMEPFGTF